MTVPDRLLKAIPLFPGLAKEIQLIIVNEIPLHMEHKLMLTFLRYVGDARLYTMLHNRPSLF